jgi:uncharacterized protein YjdB
MRLCRKGVFIMKNTFKLFGIIAVVTVIGLLASCGDGGDSSGNVVGGNVAVTSVSLNKTTLSLTVGGSETLTAAVLPSNATNKSVTWRSDSTSIATVSNGNVSAVSTGTATITVTSVDGGKSATCSVTVTQAASQVETFNSLDDFGRWLPGRPVLQILKILRITLS